MGEGYLHHPKRNDEMITMVVEFKFCSYQGCEYMTTRVEKIINNNLGVITSRNIHIMFHIENLSIDGQR